MIPTICTKFGGLRWMVGKFGELQYGTCWMCQPGLQKHVSSGSGTASHFYILAATFCWLAGLKPPT